MKYPLIIISVFLGTLSSTAQIERKTETLKPDSANVAASKKFGNKQGQSDRLKELDLSKEQKAKLKEIRQAGKSEKEAIENNAALSDADKKKQLRVFQKNQTQKILDILTPEQQVKFRDQLAENMRNKRSNNE